DRALASARSIAARRAMQGRLFALGRTPSRRSQRSTGASRRRPMTDRASLPYLVLTVLLDSTARPAAVTRSHGDALERAMLASHGLDIAGMDLVELPIAKPAFEALKRHLKVPRDAVGIYDLFPL